MGYVSALILPSVSPLIGGLIIGSVAVIYPMVDYQLGPLKLDGNESQAPTSFVEQMMKAAKMMAVVVAIIGIPSVLAVLIGHFASITISFAACVIFQLQTGIISAGVLLVLSIVENIF